MQQLIKIVLLIPMAIVTIETLAVEKPTTNKSAIDITGGIIQANRWYYNKPNNQESILINSVSTKLGFKTQPFTNLELGGSMILELSTTPTIEHTLQDHAQFSVDRAYMKTNLGDYSLSMGEFDNTFVGYYERTIPLVGAQINYAVDTLLGKFNAKGLIHLGQPLMQETDAHALAIELGTIKKLSNDISFSLNAGLMNYFDLDTDYIMSNSKSKNDFTTDFNIGNAEARLNIDLESRFKILSFYALGIHNFAAEQDNVGFIGGVTLGKLQKSHDVMLDVNIKHIEKDATLAAMTPKYTPRTGFEHEPNISLSVRLMKNLDVKLQHSFTKNIGKSGSPMNTGLILDYKF